MKKYTPLDGLRWSRDSDSALNNMPQTDVLGRAGGGSGAYSPGLTSVPVTELQIMVDASMWKSVMAGAMYGFLLFMLLYFFNGYLMITFLPFLISSPRWLLPTRRPDRS